jgi:hypothetical protein
MHPRISGRTHARRGGERYTTAHLEAIDDGLTGRGVQQVESDRETGFEMALALAQHSVQLPVHLHTSDVLDTY